MSLSTRIAAAFKELFLPAGSAAYNSPWYLGDVRSAGYTAPSAINYQAEAGPPDSNAIVMACINWVSTTFPEAPIRVQRTTGQQTATVEDHALTMLLDTPNPYYTGLDLWAATLADYNITGTTARGARWNSGTSRTSRSARAGAPTPLSPGGRFTGPAPGCAWTRGKTS
jgi:hypothetical protein